MWTMVVDVKLWLEVVEGDGDSKKLQGLGRGGRPTMGDRDTVSTTGG
jgi:hypothetical protein